MSEPEEVSGVMLPQGPWNLLGGLDESWADGWKVCPAAFASHDSQREFV